MAAFSVCKPYLPCFAFTSGLPWICAFWPFETIPSLSDPVLLFVQITEALAAFSLVDLRLVCAWSALPLCLVCAWSALRAPWGCFFLYASLTGPALTLLKDCLGSVLPRFFLCLQQAILCYYMSRPLKHWLHGLWLICTWFALGLRLVCAWSAPHVRLICA